MNKYKVNEVLDEVMTALSGEHSTEFSMSFWYEKRTCGSFSCVCGDVAIRRGASDSQIKSGAVAFANEIDETLGLQLGLTIYEGEWVERFSAGLESELPDKLMRMAHLNSDSSRKDAFEYVLALRKYLNAERITDNVLKASEEKSEGWIDVKTSLPPPHLPVVGYFQSLYSSSPFHITDCHYDNGWKMQGNDSVKDTYINNPTHWRSLGDFKL